jgi:hypothetical protein
MWATLIQRIAGALNAALNVPDPETEEVLHPVAVHSHANAEIPTVDTVRVLRGNTTGRPLYSRPIGTTEIGLEIWTTDDDSAVADQRLMELEEQVARALEQTQRAGLVFTIQILGIDADGDLFRPTVGSYLRLRVTWRQSREE